MSTASRTGVRFMAAAGCTKHYGSEDMKQVGGMLALMRKMVTRGKK